MNRSLQLLLAAFCVGYWTGPARGDEDDASQVCVKRANFLAPIDSPDHRKYAPDRDVQPLHLALDVTPDFQRRRVAGRATLEFKPLAKPVEEVKLDAVDLAVTSVTSSERIEAYQVTEDKIIVTFAAPIRSEKRVTVTIAYSAEPTAGLYFRTPEMGYKEGDAHLFSQGEEIEARHWFPCFDSPNEKFTSEVTCHVPEKMTVISNGRLVSKEADASTGLVTFHWSQEKPHANYLITLVAGFFGKLESKAGEIPLVFYTPPSEIQYATNSFRDTPDVMDFYEKEIGVAYPWPKYDQVCVNDFVAGGMENTSATTLTDSTLFTDATENIRTSESLVAHELAHQWFGDLVTCKDWSDIWLNEGFATFYESLYNGHKHGRDALLYERYQSRRQIIDAPGDTNAIVRRTFDSPREMFGHLTYAKAAWVLHMLRAQLGEDLFRRCIKTYLERHAYGSVVTENLRAVIEELSGRSYDQFFDQWLYHAHYPELEVRYAWDEKAKLAKLSVQQTQALSANVLLFSFPIAVRFKGAFGAQERPFRVTKKAEDFYFSLASAPEVVRFDPDYGLLAKINFPLAAEMLKKQLADREDVIGRLLAIEQLAQKTDQETVAELKEALEGDPFYGVRMAASRALHSMHTEEALEALLSSTNQPDARVRRELAQDVGGFYRESAYASAKRELAREKNPEILSMWLQGLAGYARPKVHDELLRFLSAKSFRNQLADAAIAAARAQDDPAYINPLIEKLEKGESDFTSRGFGQGLNAVAYLARNEEKKDAVREFLLRYVNSRKKPVQLGCLGALGVLGDPKALPVVEKYATAFRQSPERDAAEGAVAALRAARRPVDDFKELRQEVLELQKTGREMGKELEELKKRVEVRGPVPGRSTAKKAPLRQPKSSDE